MYVFLTVEKNWVGFIINIGYSDGDIVSIFSGTRVLIV